MGTICLVSKNVGNSSMIGVHCELGMNSVIIGDVRIGNNVYICVGTVVIRSFKQNEISLASIPAKIVAKK